jgi:penicillin amidase
VIEFMYESIASIINSKNLLSSRQKMDTEDMKKMQGDLISIQAERFMEILRPLIPKAHPIGTILANWNCSYDKHSKGAVIFEKFYENLLDDVFGKIAGSAWPHAKQGMGAYFHYLDKAIFEYAESLDDLLWKGESRNDLFRRVLQFVLKEAETTSKNYSGHFHSLETIPTYGEENQVYMENIFFAGKFRPLTRLLGYDFGPFPMEGSRATVTFLKILRNL